VILNTSCSVDHDCVVEDFAHLAPGVRLAGNVHVGEGALLGVGSCVIPGVRIGRWATVGAGAAVIEDVPDYATVVGVPARVIKIGEGPE
jgi:acetyltransferase EpsM